MNINTVDLTAEEAREILADGRLILASIEEVQQGIAATAERDQLRAEVERLRALLCAECGGTSEISSGICYCGNDCDKHTVHDGHAPVEIPNQCGTCAKKERMIEIRGAYRELQRIVDDDCGIVFGGDLPHVCRETLEARILELQQEEGTIWA